MDEIEARVTAELEARLEVALEAQGRRQALAGAASCLTRAQRELSSALVLLEDQEPAVTAHIRATLAHVQRHAWDVELALRQAASPLAGRAHGLAETPATEAGATVPEPAAATQPQEPTI